MFNLKVSQPDPEPVVKSLTMIEKEIEMCREAVSRASVISSSVDKEMEFSVYARECADAISECRKTVESFGLPNAADIIRRAEDEYERVVHRTVRDALASVTKAQKTLDDQRLC